MPCILLAEDDQLFRYCIANILRKNGYEVIEAQDGIEALEQWMALESKPDLVLSDINMPRMGGRELAVRLRQYDPNVRVLFASAEEEMPSGDCLRKPFHAGDLLSAIRSHLAEAA